MQTHDPHVVHAFFCERLGLHWSEDFRGALYIPEQYVNSLARPEHVAVGVAFNAFIGRTCCIHTVIQQPEYFSRKIIRDSFHYAFNECGCEVVLALIDDVNTASLELVQRLGFKELTRVPHGGTEGDLILMQMTRSECRWIRRTMH